MKFTQTEYGTPVEIIHSGPYIADEITVDFTDTAFSTDKIAKAGTPMAKDGKKAADASTTYGILLYDVTDANPNGAVVIAGFINKAVAEAHAGVTFDETYATALPMIKFME